MGKRWAFLIALAIVLAVPEMTKLGVASEKHEVVRVERLLDAPIITPATHPSIGANIQGPSLIRVPEWVENPLGRYYLYFADHKGSYIRLAYADDLLGPWHVHAPGSLQIKDTHFPAEPPPIPPGELERIRAERAKSKGGKRQAAALACKGADRAAHCVTGCSRGIVRTSGS